jgi:hypothetical protein
MACAPGKTPAHKRKKPGSFGIPAFAYSLYLFISYSFLGMLMGLKKQG